MKVTRQQVLEIFNVLTVINKEKMPPKGAYAISKNKNVAKREVEVIQEAQNNVKMPEGLTEFNDKRIELCREFSNKDEEGNVLVIGPDGVAKPEALGAPTNGTYDIPFEVRPDFEKAVDELRDSYKEAFDERDKINTEFEELLSEEIELEFHTVKDVDWLPKEIAGEHMELLMDTGIVDEG